MQKDGTLNPSRGGDKPKVDFSSAHWTPRRIYDSDYVGHPRLLQRNLLLCQERVSILYDESRNFLPGADGSKLLLTTNTSHLCICSFVTGNAALMLTANIATLAHDRNLRTNTSNGGLYRKRGGHVGSIITDWEAELYRVRGMPL